MATTSLFVEIIVIGSLAELWFVAFLVALQPRGSIGPLLARMSPFDSAGAAIVAVMLAITCAVGWGVNFLSERTFKSIFEKRLRDHLFAGSATVYREAHVLVFQKGSTDLLQEFVLDRHIIRIVRSNVFNFLLLGLGLLFNHQRLPQSTLVVLVVACWFIAVSSFLQWMTRYQSYYRPSHSCAAAAGGRNVPCRTRSSAL